MCSIKAAYQGRVCQGIHCGAADGHGGQLLHCIAEGTHSLLQARSHLCLVLSHLQGMLASTLDFRVAELFCEMRHAVMAHLRISLELAGPLKRICMALRSNPPDVQADCGAGNSFLDDVCQQTSSRHPGHAALRSFPKRPL